MKEFKCEVCEKVYCQKATLWNHYNQKHNDSETEHNCNIFTKVFAIKQNLLMKEI